MPLNRVEIFRHGVARYAQEIVDWNVANDLTGDGLITVRANALRLAQDYRGIATKVAIFSSPLGRTLETSLILNDELTRAGLETEGEGGAPIIVRKCLQDQFNFSNSIIHLLACGGRWSGLDGEATIDPEQTNPAKKRADEYLTADALGLDKEVWGGLPLDLRKKILSMETVDQVARRFLRFMNSLGKLNKGRDLTLVVTHEALIGQLLRNAGSETTKVNPGGRVTAEIIDEELVISNIAGIIPRKKVAVKLERV